MERTKHSLKSGIYQIESIATNKLYIGQSTNLEKRKSSHFNKLLNGDHGNIHLQRHVNMYGVIDLVFSVIERCHANFLLEKEKRYVKLLNPEFNIDIVIKRKLSQETRDKISKSTKERFKNPEEREKIRIGAYRWRVAKGYATKVFVEPTRDAEYYALSKKEKEYIVHKERRLREQQKRIESLYLSTKS